MDVDTGTDDALALLYAIGHPDIDVIGISCVAGNAGVEQVVINTSKVLDAAGAGEIPVARGASRPLIERSRPESDFHGADGLGGVALPESTSRTVATAGGRDAESADHDVDSSRSRSSAWLHRPTSPCCSPSIRRSRISSIGLSSWAARRAPATSPPSRSSMSGKIPKLRRASSNRAFPPRCTALMSSPGWSSTRLRPTGSAPTVIRRSGWPASCSTDGAPDRTDRRRTMSA